MTEMQITSVELNKRFGHYQAMAQRQPVIVTNHGEPRSVLMSAETYQQLLQSYRQSLSVTELSGDDLAMIAKAKVHPRHRHLNARDSL